MTANKKAKSETKPAESAAPNSAAKAKVASQPVQPVAEPVKKVSPYPIDVQIMKSEGQPPLKAQIWRLTEFGFLIKADKSHLYKVAEEYIAQFALPVLNHQIKSRVKVVKTHDALESFSREGHTTLYTIEMHFISLPEVEKKWVTTYLAKIKQRRT